MRNTLADLKALRNSLVERRRSEVHFITMDHHDEVKKPRPE